MKTTSLLFGLAAGAASPSNPRYPLCDDKGAPACGNIGQVGRSTPATADAKQVAATHTVAASAARVARVVPVATRVLLQASSDVQHARAIGRRSSTTARRSCAATS